MNIMVMMMMMMMMMEIEWRMMICLMVMVIFPSTRCRVMGAEDVTAMFAFGDSLTDPGNNNYLNSFAKANYMPYGVDFYGGMPSGRFCNGKTFVDFLGEMLGLPVLPPYMSPFATGRNIVRGVNYASAAGGILEETGRNLGERFSLSQQVVNFESTVSDLRRQMGDAEMSNYLAKALVIMCVGSNDYINNYLQPSFYATSYIYSPKDYADLLINRYTTQILALHSSGLRKFLVGGIGPLGCIPNQVATGKGKCIAYTNDIASIFNTRLRSLVDNLNTNYSNNMNNGTTTIFAYGNTFGVFSDILNNANTYGFNVTDRGCCGIGRKRGQITCLPLSTPCNNRKQHIFWDAFHPTEAVNRILAHRAYWGSSSDCHPLNVRQMMSLM